MDEIPGVKINGVRYLQHTTPEFLKAYSQLQTRSDDVIICTWPKSGTTWTQNILWKIYRDGDHKDSRIISERVPFIEGVVVPHCPNFTSNPAEVSEIFGKMPSPRFLKTHLPYELVPKGSDKATAPRYIYVMRNPKDAAVSFYHQYVAKPADSYSKPWDHFFDLFMKNEVRMGSWFDHVLGWWEHQDDPRILFLKYEDMKKDLSGTIKKIATFVKKDLSLNAVERIASETRFTSMRADNTVNYSWNSLFTRPFLRKGEVGDWRNLFTPEQNRLFDKIYAERMDGTGLEFYFGEENEGGKHK